MFASLFLLHSVCSFCTFVHSMCTHSFIHSLIRSPIRLKPLHSCISLICFPLTLTHTCILIRLCFYVYVMYVMALDYIYPKLIYIYIHINHERLPRLRCPYFVVSADLILRFFIFYIYSFQYFIATIRVSLKYLKDIKYECCIFIVLHVTLTRV